MSNSLSALASLTQYIINLLAVAGMRSKLGWSGKREPISNQTFLKQKDGCQIEIVWKETEEKNLVGITIFCHPYFKFGLDYILNKQTPVYECLLKNNHHVVFFNFKGYGKSTYRFSNFSNYANDIHEVTNWVKEKYPNIPIYLYGYSLGAYWACCAASKSFSYQGIILDSPPATLFVRDDSPFVNIFKYSVQVLIGYFDLPGSRSLYDGILQNIKLPILMLYGTSDIIITQKDIKKIKEAKPDIEMIAFEDCDHLQASKSPDHATNYLIAVLNFLKQNSTLSDSLQTSLSSQSNLG